MDILTANTFMIDNDTMYVNVVSDVKIIMVLDIEQHPAVDGCHVTSVLAELEAWSRSTCQPVVPGMLVC